VKKTSVPIVDPEVRLIPFATYNLFYFYGGNLEKSRLRAP
jgi:hypothetical protein